jgi:hypothetical protein
MHLPWFLAAAAVGGVGLELELELRVGPTCARAHVALV